MKEIHWTKSEPINAVQVQEGDGRMEGGKVGGEGPTSVFINLSSLGVKSNESYLHPLSICVNV